MAETYFYRQTTWAGDCLAAWDNHQLNKTIGSDTTITGPGGVSNDVFETQFDFTIDVSGDSPAGGTFTLKLELTVATKVNVRMRAEAIDITGCVVGDVSDWSPDTGMSGVGTFSFALANLDPWPAAAELLRVVIQARRNPGDHGNYSYVMNVSTADSQIIAPFTAGAALVKLAPDTETIVEDIARFMAQVRERGETETVAEDIVRALDFVREVGDTETIVEAVNYLKAHPEIVDEVVQIGETAAAIRGLIKIVGGGAGGILNTDDFNRANSDNLGGDWTEFGESDGGTNQWQINGNLLRVKPGGDAFQDMAVRHNTPTGSLDHWVKFKATQDNARAYGACLRVDDPASTSDHYECSWNPSDDEIRWTRYLDGAGTFDRTLAVPGGELVNAHTDGNYYAYAIIGTGTATQLKFWDFGSTDPGNDTSTWPAADVTYDDDAGTMSDTGQYAGLRAFTLSPFDSPDLDDFASGPYPTPATAGIAIAETVLAFLGLVKERADTVTIVEAINRLKTQIRTRDETVTISDGIVRFMAMTRTREETVTIADSIVRLMAMTRIRDETVTIGEGVIEKRTTSGTAFVEFADDLVQISESINLLLSMVRLADDAVTISDGIVRALDFARLIDDVVAIGENITRLRTRIEPIDETVQISEAIVRLLGTFEVVPTEVVQISETIQRVLGTIEVVPTDTVTIADAVLKVLGFVREASDTVTVSEGVLERKAKTELVPDTVAISETIARARTLARTQGDDVTIDEAIVRAITFVRLIPDDVTIDEVIVRLLGLSEVVPTDTVTIGETVVEFRVIGGTDFVKFADDVVAIAESINRRMAKTEPVDETVTISEVALGLLAIVRPVPDTVTIADGVVRILDFARAVNETITISEEINRRMAQVRALDETVTISETVARIAGFVRIEDETVTISEQILDFLIQVLTRDVSSTVQIGEGVLEILSPAFVPYAGLSTFVANLKARLEALGPDFGTVLISPRRWAREAELRRDGAVIDVPGLSPATRFWLIESWLEIRPLATCELEYVGRVKLTGFYGWRQDETQAEALLAAAAQVLEDLQLQSTELSALAAGMGSGYCGYLRELPALAGPVKSAQLMTGAQGHVVTIAASYVENVAR